MGAAGFRHRTTSPPLTVPEAPVDCPHDVRRAGRHVRPAVAGVRQDRDAMTAAAALLASALFLAMAAFQAALALGAPYGAHVLGGRQSGTLPGRLRVFSAVAAVILVAGTLVVLARAGTIGWPAGAAGLLTPALWAIAGFLALNTLGNLTSRSRLERTVFAATTAVLVVLCAYVAITGTA